MRSARQLPVTFVCLPLATFFANFGLTRGWLKYHPLQHLLTLNKCFGCEAFSVTRVLSPAHDLMPRVGFSMHHEFEMSSIIDLKHSAAFALRGLAPREPCVVRQQQQSASLFPGLCLVMTSSQALQHIKAKVLHFCGSHQRSSSTWQLPALLPLYHVALPPCSELLSFPGVLLPLLVSRSSDHGGFCWPCPFSNAS